MDSPRRFKQIHFSDHTGRREEAEQLAAASSFNPFNQAQIFACLGDKDRAMKLWIAPLRLDPFGWAGRSHFQNWPSFAVIRE